MHKIFQIPFSFYCPLPLPSHEEAVPKNTNALCRDWWEHDYTGTFCTSCGEWHLFLSAHMDRAHDIVIFCNISLIIKALFSDLRLYILCRMLMQNTHLITQKGALDREHDKCCNRD